MNKILCTLLLVLSFFSINAQAQVSQEEMQALVQRVDSLEHELAYLKLSCNLSDLKNDISIFTNNINATQLAIQTNFYHRNFNSKLGNAYQRNYKASLIRKQSISYLIDTLKSYFNFNISTHTYTETELATLKACFGSINAAYDSLEEAMSLLKITIDTYNEAL